MSRIRVEELEDYGTGEVFRVSGIARKEETLEVVEYGEGVLIESRNTLIRDADNKFWVASSNTTLPYLTTGAGIPEDGALVPIGGGGDAMLRQELADPAKGAAMVAYGDGSVADKLDEIVSGGGGSAPVEWIEGVGEAVPLTDLSPNTMYILDVRSGNWLDVFIPENHSDIPVGSEYHFVCAGDPENVYIYEYQPAPEEHV